MTKVLKAKLNVVRALDKSVPRWRVVWLLDADTVLALDRLLAANPDTEPAHLKSILEKPVSFAQNLMRENLRSYVANYDYVHAIIKKSVPNDMFASVTTNDAGEVFRWLRHFNAGGSGPVKDHAVLKLVASWVIRPLYMSLLFKFPDEEGILEFVRMEPELLDRTIEVLNAVPNTGYIVDERDLSLVVEHARSVPALQEGAL